jgi:hypothetical protein
MCLSTYAIFSELVACNFEMMAFSQSWSRTNLIGGLTPGTTYAIQVRAYGQLGYTEYSDSATRMVI